MHELTVFTKNPTKKYPYGRHFWQGPLGTERYVIDFDAAHYPAGTVIRVEIVWPPLDESAAADAPADAAETLRQQTPGK